MAAIDVADRRRRTIAAVVALGALIGVATGVAVRSAASRSATIARAPILVHSARIFAEPGRPVGLEVAAFCVRPQDPVACRIRSGTVHVTPAGRGPVDLPGETHGDRVRFEIPASLVGSGFRYWFDVTDASGRTSAYPPGGAAASLEVRTTAGLPEIALPEFRWNDTLRGTAVLRLPYGAAPGEVGIEPPRGDGLASGESSFDVGPDGDIYVADRVNRRIQVFDDEGRYRSALSLPDDRAVDLAVSEEGDVYTATLGDTSHVTRLHADGSAARSAVPFGVVARLRIGAGSPMALVGDAQYLPVPVGGSASTHQLRAAPPALGDGTALTGPVGDRRFATTWTDEHGVPHGAVVRLPEGTSVGSDYFTVVLPGGGAVVAQGIYAPGHNVVAILRLDADGGLRSFVRLPEPSFRQDARWSTVRWRAPDEVLAIYEQPDGVRIDRFEVI